MFGRRGKEVEINTDEKVVSVNKYKIIGYGTMFVFGNYRSIVAVRDEEGCLQEIELVNCNVDENVKNITGSYVQVTTYENGDYITRLIKE